VEEILKGPIDFEWDEGNILKSYSKHDITIKEAESIFIDTYLSVAEDTKHSINEKRYAAVGTSINARILFVVYTIRKRRIRIISARPANRKERRHYEEIKETPAI